MKILMSFSPVFIPLAKILHQQGHTIVGMHPNFTKMLNDQDIPAKSLPEFLDGKYHFEALNYAARTLGTLGNGRFSHDFPANMTSGARNFVSKSLPAFLYSRLGDISTFVSMIEKYSPELVIVHNDVDPMCRSAAFWAKSHKIPCLHIPHAIHMDIGRGKATNSDIHDLITASHLAVAGPYHAKWYLDRGANPKTMRVTGLPQHDKLAKITQNRSRSCSLLGLDPNKPIVTYASSWRQDTNLLGCHDGVEEYFVKFVSAIALLPGIQTVIKLHPNGTGSAQWHADRAKEKGIHCLVLAAHLEHVLAVSDALISYGPSNILLEASVYSDVRLIATHGFFGDEEIAKLGEEAKEDEIAGGIRAILSAPVLNYSALRSKYFGRLDGGATARIVQYIEEICKT